MKKVFISGSRKIKSLHKTTIKHITNIVSRNFTICVGDAYGADKAVQVFLAEKGYRNVLVFCSGNKCRNNIGNWETINIKVAQGLSGIKFYMAKDYEMAKAADYGFMLWDGKSAGTLNNIINMLKLHKKSLVYFSLNKQIYKVFSFSDLKIIIEKCKAEDMVKAIKKIQK